MVKFTNVLFLLFIVPFSCSYRGTVNNDSINVSTNLDYDSLRQKFKDSLDKGLENVNDFYKLYTYVQKATLDSAITGFEKRTKLKITVITFDSTMTSSDSVESATRIIGIKNKINTTIGISPDFKKMYIWNDSLINNTVFTQHETKEVIEEKFIPSFIKGNFYEGTSKGLEAITTTIEKRLTVNF
jgi:hypothetical protein